MRSRGFTLLELLTSVALFGVLAVMLFQMLKGSLDIWRQGEGGREVLEKGNGLLDEITRDLRMLRADGPPGVEETPVRLLSDYGIHDLDQNEIDESYLQRIRFVRSCPEERFDPKLRKAGDLPGGKDAANDLGFETGLFRAPGGMAEIAYATLNSPGKGNDPALLNLYRVFRTPIGGDGSIFTSPMFNKPKDMEDSAVLLASNILYLGFEFWWRDTVSFDDLTGVDGGPLTCWDSTRGILLAASGQNHFLLARGQESLLNSDDDVFPRCIRITLSTARDEDDAAVVKLAARVSDVSTRLQVDSARPFTSQSEDPYLKIDGEWMRWTAMDGSFLTVERAQRGTAKMDHAQGARVHVGETFRRVVEIPVFREDWNSTP